MSAVPAENRGSDSRWLASYNEIPRLVRSAREKMTPPSSRSPSRLSIALRPQAESDEQLHRQRADRSPDLRRDPFRPLGRQDGNPGRSAAARRGRRSNTAAGASYSSPSCTSPWRATRASATACSPGAGARHSRRAVRPDPGVQQFPRARDRKESRRGRAAADEHLRRRLPGDRDRHLHGRPWSRHERLRP